MLIFERGVMLRCCTRENRALPILACGIVAVERCAKPLQKSDQFFGVLFIPYRLRDGLPILNFGRHGSLARFRPGGLFGLDAEVTAFLMDGLTAFIRFGGGEWYWLPALNTVNLGDGLAVHCALRGRGEGSVTRPSVGQHNFRTALLGSPEPFGGGSTGPRLRVDSHSSCSTFCVSVQY